jgi:hypothetical protein
LGDRAVNRFESRIFGEALMRPKDKIHTYANYDRFLRAAGFSKREARILSKAWFNLPRNSGLPDIAMLAFKSTEIDVLTEKLDHPGQ